MDDANLNTPQQDVKMNMPPAPLAPHSLAPWCQVSREDLTMIKSRYRALAMFWVRGSNLFRSKHVDGPPVLHPPHTSYVQCR